MPSIPTSNIKPPIKCTSKYLCPDFIAEGEELDQITSVEDIAIISQKIYRTIKSPENMTPTAEAMYNNTNDFSDIDFWYIENIFPTIPKIKKTRQNKNDNFVDEIIFKFILSNIKSVFEPIGSNNKKINEIIRDTIDIIFTFVFTIKIKIDPTNKGNAGCRKRLLIIECILSF
jgi:hypothetical protein